MYERIATCLPTAAVEPAAAAMAGTRISLEAQAVVGAMVAAVGGPGGTSAILVESLRLILGS